VLFESTLGCHDFVAAAIILSLLPAHLFFGEFAEL